MHELITHLVAVIAGLSIDFMELLSIGIIVYTTFFAFYKLLKKKSQRAHFILLHGQSIGLTFKLGSEILRTVTVRNMDEILQIAMLIVIKAAMTWLIHWELSGIEQEQESKNGHTRKVKSLSERVHEKLHPETIEAKIEVENETNNH